MENISIIMKQEQTPAWWSSILREFQRKVPQDCIQNTKTSNGTGRLETCLQVSMLQWVEIIEPRPKSLMAISLCRLIDTENLRKMFTLFIQITSQKLHFVLPVFLTNK